MFLDHIVGVPGSTSTNHFQRICIGPLYLLFAYGIRIPLAYNATLYSGKIKMFSCNCGVFGVCNDQRISCFIVILNIVHVTKRIPTHIFTHSLTHSVTHVQIHTNRRTKQMPFSCNRNNKSLLSIELNARRDEKKNSP